ncbi:HD domain-containing protein [Rhizobium leguminosarum]|uniref:HD domain-containing protein n=1 Tax=Rhizobium leguminosarum TaxID=384 RepID=UPI003F9D5A30
MLGEIKTHLVHYTVHDITHADTLWEYSELIAGPSYPLNPVEAFVLGAAFLVHDAGMALPAVGGIEALQRDEFFWRAHVNEAFVQYTGREPTDSDIADPPTEIVNSAISAMLRERHAAMAESLVSKVWTWEDRQFLLIEDAQLRDVLGPSIGRVAAFHGSPIASVDAIFGDEGRIGAPTFLPEAWSYDVLKLALLLRTADAAHLDDRRAPPWVAALRRPAGPSLPHWQFQALLNRPLFIEKASALRYEARAPFPPDRADAWWLAYDSLRSVDHELASADALLRDRRSEAERFLARGVQNVRSPAQFSQCLRVVGWRPIDSAVKIEDPTVMIRRLGGEQLYGNDFTAPVRELLQNAVDAVLARRTLEDNQEIGKIEVELAVDSAGGWSLSVSDDGIGMDEEILTTYLLSFGKSFWRSPHALQKFPQLFGKTFRSTGRFGIGFFSVFMLSDNISITTRLYDAGVDDYRTLRFTDGLKSRPVLLLSAKESRPKGYSTRVSVLIDEKTVLRILQSADERNRATLISQIPIDEGFAVLLSRIAPALPVDLVLKTSKCEKQVIRANDWTNLEPDDLFERLNGRYGWMGDRTTRTKRKKRKESMWMFEAMRPIYALTDASKSKPVGRLGFFPAEFMQCEHLLMAQSLCCAILVGPFLSTRINKLAGLIAGDATRAARDNAVVDTTKLDWESWIREQCDRMADGLSVESFDTQAHAASELLQLGGLPLRLNIVLSNSGPYSLNTVGSWIDNRESFTLHMRGYIGPDEDPPPNDILVGRSASHDYGPVVLQGISPNSLPDVLLEICRERWGGSGAERQEMSSGTWEFRRSRS